jgi:GH25 family lysozyme M1 (1,4-beta-N-acetylmuramidase)
VVASAQGLDVSNFQGAFNWAGTSGLSFGIYRLTQGLGASGTNSPDPQAAHNHSAIAAKGLDRGQYHFNDPSLSGPAQATYFVSQLTKLGMTATDMLWLDHETAPSGMTPAAIAAQAVAAMAELDKLVPHNPRGVYTFIDFAKEGYCAGLEDYPLWLAYPASAAPAAPPPWSNWRFWQWGTRNGDDTDAFNGTAAQLSAWLATYHSGPVRHVADGTKSLNEIATAANTTATAIAETSVRILNQRNLDRFLGYLVSPGAAAKTPKGLVYWTAQ